MARKAILDYENTPEWVETLGKTGISPFARFPFHATKATAKALWERPANVSSYYKPVNQSDKDTMDILPDYLEPQNLVPLWEGTKKVNGENVPVKNHLDVSYIMPFANDINIGNPAMEAWQLFNTGRNSLNQEVIHPGMSDKDKAQAYFDAIVRNGIAPAMLSKYTWDKLGNAVTGKVDSKGRSYDLDQALANTVLGLKNVPVNIEEEYTKRQTGLKNDARNIQAQINRIKKDKSLTEEQRKEDVREYQKRKQKVEQEQKELAERYQKYLTQKPKNEKPKNEKPKKQKRKLKREGM